MDGERGCVAAVVPLGLGDSVGAGVGGTRFSLHGGSLFGSDSGVSGKDREPRGGGRYWRTRILIGGYRSHSGGSAIGSWRRISGRGGGRKPPAPPHHVCGGRAPRLYLRSTVWTLQDHLVGLTPPVSVFWSAGLSLGPHTLDTVAGTHFGTSSGAIPVKKTDMALARLESQGFHL